MIYTIETIRNLSFVEKKTFVLHLVFSIIEGITLGVFALNEFVFINSLKGTDFQLGLLFLIMNVVFLFSVLFNEILKRYQNKKKLLIWVAILTRFPMFFFILFPKDIQVLTSTEFYHLAFIFIFLIYYMAKPVLMPLINLFLKHNYQEQNFGKLFSYSTMFNNIFMVFATFLFGIAMDIEYNWYRIIYPIIGFLSIISIVLLAYIRVDFKPEIIKLPLKTSLINSFKNSWDILKNNRPYLDFEIGFMLYGFAWMTCFTIVPKFYDEVLALNNSSVAFYKNFYYIIAFITLPFFGKHISKIDPRKFANISFWFMFFTILFLAMSEYFPNFYDIINIKVHFYFINFEIIDIKVFYFLVFSNIAYGLFAGSMPLIWGIGSTYFCKKEESANYQAVHLSLVGIRAAFSPIIGILLLHAYNYTFTYGAGMATLLLAIIYMRYSMKRS